MLRPTKRRILLTTAFVLFFPLYGCMVIAPLSLITLSFFSSKMPAAWWLIFIHPVVIVGGAFNYILALTADYAIVKLLSTERARMYAAVTIVLLMAVVPFFVGIYGWAGPTGGGEWATFPEFFKRALK